MATRTPGSNEQYEIHKYSINGHKRTPGSNEQYRTHKYSINGHKNAWLKRAIWNTEMWNTQIIDKWPQENAWHKLAFPHLISQLQT